MWTRFIDCHSGGGRKTDFDTIYIELPEVKAVIVFKQKLGRDPYNTTCECCGEDFSIDEFEEILSLDSDEEILIISKSDLI